MFEKPKLRENCLDYNSERHFNLDLAVLKMISSMSKGSNPIFSNHIYFNIRRRFTLEKNYDLRLTILLLQSMYLKSMQPLASLLGEMASSLGRFGVCRLGDLLALEPLEDLLECVEP